MKKVLTMGRCGLAIALILTSVASAGTAPRFNVRMDVTAEDDIRSKIQIGFARVFKSIPDVQVVEANDDWVISAVIAPIRVNKGPVIAYAFSTLIGTTEQNRALVQSLSHYFKNADVKSKFDELVSDNYVIVSHRVQVVAPNEVERSAEDVIREFNMETLEAQRKRASR